MLGKIGSLLRDPKVNAKKWLIVIVVIFLGFTFIKDILLPNRIVNYRLEIAFEVDGVPVFGSGVQQLSIRRVPQILTTTSIVKNVYGEAVVIDLLDRGAIFALLGSPVAKNEVRLSSIGLFNSLLMRSCGLTESLKHKTWNDYIRSIGRITGECEIAHEDLPIFVHFSDETDPYSAQRVDPENPDTTLGKGIRFLNARLVVTNERISQKIDQRLDWLTDDSGKRLVVHLDAEKQPFARSLTNGMFRRMTK